MGVGARGEGERPPTGEEEGGCARGARPGRRGGARCAARRRLAATLAAADGAHAPAWRDGERGERRGRRQRGHVPSWCDRPRDKREVRNIHSRRVAGPVQPQETCFRSGHVCVRWWTPQLAQRLDRRPRTVAGGERATAAGGGTMEDHYTVLGVENTASTVRLARAAPPAGPAPPACTHSPLVASSSRLPPICASAATGRRMRSGTRTRRRR